MRHKLFIIGLFLISKLMGAVSGKDVVHWSVGEGRIFEDGYVVVSLQLTTDDDYALYEDDITFASEGSHLLEKVRTPAATTRLDPETQKTVVVLGSGGFSSLFTKLDMKPETSLPLAVTYRGCSKTLCLFPETIRLNIPLVQTSSSADLMFPELFSEVGDQQAESAPANKVDLESTLAANTKNSGSSDLLMGGPIWWMVWLIFLGGLLTNLTPCVFPMIPVTIRILGGQTSKVWLGSLLYSLGIVVSYTTLGMMASSSGVMFGKFMSYSWVNLLISMFMALMALAMLGAIPMHKLQAVGIKFGGKGTSWKNCLWMGAGAGLVAAPCTGPILAALLAYSATATFSETLWLMLAYSIGFALPYMFVGILAQRLQNLKVPAQFSTAIKIAFASVLFGLSFYYLRIPLYPWVKGLKETGGTTWVAVGGIALIFGALARKWAWIQSLMFGLMLMSAITQFQNWQVQNGVQVIWENDEELAWQRALEDNKPILVDFWAEWCEACKAMEVLFQDPEIAHILKTQFHLLRFDLTEATDENEWIQTKYAVSGLPAMVMIPDPAEPTARITLEGKVDKAALMDWLKKGRPEIPQS